MVNWGKLGRDFWLFRIGQVVSVLGDACGGIALAWWVLESTGSAATMSAIIAPALFVRIVLLPLFGPLGDKFDRKRILFVSDLWRCACYLGIGALAYSGIFHLPAVLALYIAAALGSAAFESVSTSIIPQIVAREHLQAAMRQNQAIDSVGMIVGGIAGGLLVSLTGVAGAFFIDGISFLTSAVLSISIVANTKPVRAAAATATSAVREWAADLREGFQLLFKIKVLFWLAIVAMLMNLAVSPMGVILPVLVKESRGMPAWFLGALQSSVSAGAVIGSLSLGYLLSRISQDKLVALGILIIGAGVAGLPWIPNAALPVTLMFVIGAGAAIANVLLSSQEALAIPDVFRSRINSIMIFLCMLASPVGIGLSGWLIESFGLISTLMGMGMTVVVITPFIFLIPDYTEFMRADPEQAASFFRRHYPQAFKDELTEARSQDEQGIQPA